MGAEPPFLEATGISKRFPGVQALDGVNLEVRPGEVHLLLGENGAGKSTLIKLLSGVFPPDAGEIRSGGRPVRFGSPRDAQALGISTIYQEFNLAPDLSVAANVFLGREPLKNRWLGIVDRRQLDDLTRDLLAGLGLEISPRTLVKDLGVAEQQMVEIAKALSIDARLIVMDEPTAALTSHEIDRLFETIRRLKERQVAVIYISHRLNEVTALGDRATILRDGKSVATVNVRSTPVQELIRLMVGRELKDRFPKISRQPGEEALRVERLERAGVFDGVSFQVRRGEILGIAGLVGSRRTEMARAIFGADALDGGEIFVRGRRVDVRRPADAIRHGIALVPEDRKRHGILPHLSVSDNITLSGLSRFSRNGLLQIARAKALAREYVRSLRIATPDLERWVLYLSGGNQQKVVIAKWLNTKAEVFLFDEPTRGIDVGAKVEVYRLMGDLVQRGAAIVMISSELPEILGMSDRVLVMHDGTICGEFARHDATEEAILSCALAGGSGAADRGAVPGAPSPS